MRRSSLAAVFLVTACGAESSTSGPAPSGSPWFEECARERGIVFDHVSGHAGNYLFPEIMCGGVALFDMDGDADLDAYLVQAGSLTEPPESRPGNRLFENLGTGTFRDVTAGSGAEVRGYGMGVAAGDYDNDGDVDLYVTNVGANALLRNDGAGRFTDVTSEAGVGETGWSASSAFFDIEGDGDLDLYVANYIRWSIADEIRCDGPPRGPDYCSPRSYPWPATDTLYRNDGNGAFTDVSREAGLRTAFGNGLGVICGDFDGDGRADVFVANDGTMNQLWLNRGEGRFEDAALLHGCAVDLNGVAKAGMGVAAADFDGDGDEEVFVANLRNESDSFYRNDGRYFSDRTALAGLGIASLPLTRFGCALEDFDDDGFHDLFVATGGVTRAETSFGPDPYAQPEILFRGTPEQRFEEVLPRGGTSEPLIATGRGAAFGDVDGDGAIDVVIVNRDGPAHLLRNVASPRGGWITLRLVERHGRDALGAVVSARAGARPITRVARSAYSYCSASDPRVHVGLGSERGLSEVLVRWPDGRRESFGDLPGGRVHVLREGQGTTPEEKR
ncbi:MAG: CRTAC1 family protein [Planctomycetota bacterium]